MFSSFLLSARQLSLVFSFASAPPSESIAVETVSPQSPDSEKGETSLPADGHDTANPDSNDSQQPSQESATVSDASPPKDGEVDAPSSAESSVAGQAAEPVAPKSQLDAGVPEDTRYSTSKDSGQVMSGRQTKEESGLPEEVEKVGKQKKKAKGLSHFRTAIVGANIGIGWGIIAAGDKFCGEFSSSTDDEDKRKPLCALRRPAFLNFELGYGITKRIDLMVGLHIALEKRSYDFGPCSDGNPCAEGKGLFAENRMIGFSPGIRVWGKKVDKLFKVGGAVDVLYIYEGFDGYRNRQSIEGERNDNDNLENERKVGDSFLGLRGGPVFQIDSHHNIGVVIRPSIVGGMKLPKAGAADRLWLELGFEATVGVQARFP